MEDMIQVEHVSLYFKQTKALSDLHFQVKKGEIFGFLGPSGAGKTTTIKLLSGQLKQHEGNVYMFQEEVLKQRNTLYRRIGILSDNSGLYEELSVYENLRLFADIHHLPASAIDEVLERIHLQGEEKKLAKKLSRGMRQRLLFAIAILHKPEVLFLDEPTSALDPATSEAVHAIILDLHKQGTTIFLTTHNMEEADMLCDRVAFLHHGEIVELGNPDALKLKYAQNQIHILTNRQSYTIQKDAEGLSELLPTLEKEGIQKIHSVEPDLKTIFLDITGREL